MNTEIRLEHASFTICATGIQLISKAWKCAFVILQNDVPLLKATTVSPVDTRAKAELNAIAVAKRIVDDEIADAGK